MIRVFNDDCCSVLYSQTFQDLIKGKKAVIVSDPPFNVGYHYGTYKDNKDEDEYFAWLDNIISGFPAIIIHYPEALYKLSFKIGRFPDKVVSWVYNSNTAKQHRDIAFFGIKPDFTLIRQPYKNPTDKRIMERIARGCRGGRLYDWWDVNQVKNISKDKTQHPCQMPLKVMENIIGIIPDKDNLLVIDPFMGSGTTGLACQKYGIDFIGIEIDENYFEIARQRLNENYQQITLEELADGRTTDHI